MYSKKKAKTGCCEELTGAWHHGSLRNCAHLIGDSVVLDFFLDNRQSGADGVLAISVLHALDAKSVYFFTGWPFMLVMNVRADGFKSKSR